MTNMSLAHNFAMGEVGVGTPSFYHINNLNPAWLPLNAFSVFELGLQGENRSVSNELNTVSGGTGGFKYLTFAFPVIYNKWTSSVGAMPYSSVNYKFSSTLPINPADDGVNPEYTISGIAFDGTGGLTQVYWSNGVRFGKYWFAGLRMAYVFGFTESTNTTILIDDIDQITQFPSGDYEKTNYKGFEFQAGAGWRKEVKDNTFINVGLSYKFKSDLNGSRFVRTQVNIPGRPAVIGDTLEIDQPGEFNLPGELTIGLSYEKFNKYTIGLDIKHSNWDTNAGFGEDNETFRKTLTIAAGFEFIPDITDVNSYLSRIKYRVGISYQQLPYVIAGNHINDFGINFGWSLPVKGVSAVNMSFKLGQRGALNKDLIRERYFKFVLGATINDRWFVRRKYN